VTPGEGPRTDHDVTEKRKVSFEVFTAGATRRNIPEDTILQKKYSLSMPGIESGSAGS
jgi:hypothetical protein